MKNLGTRIVQAIARLLMVEIGTAVDELEEETQQSIAANLVEHRQNLRKLRQETDSTVTGAVIGIQESNLQDKTEQQLTDLGVDQETAKAVSHDPPESEATKAARTLRFKRQG